MARAISPRPQRSSPGPVPKAWYFSVENWVKAIEHARHMRIAVPAARAVVLLAAASAALTAFTIGCSGGDKRAADAQVPVAPSRTDVEGLERLINLPCRPIEVKWTTATQPGGNDWSLRALLRIGADDLQQILKRAGDESSTRKALMSPEQLAWMPEAIRTEAGISDAGGGLIQVDAVRIGVEQFAAPSKSPVIHGAALVFEKHNVVYLGLFTM